METILTIRKMFYLGNSTMVGIWGMPIDALAVHGMRADGQMEPAGLGADTIGLLELRILKWLRESG